MPLVVDELTLSAIDNAVDNERSVTFDPGAVPAGGPVFDERVALGGAAASGRIGSGFVLLRAESTGDGISNGFVFEQTNRGSAATEGGLQFDSARRVTLTWSFQLNSRFADQSVSSVSLTTESGVLFEVDSSAEEIKEVGEATFTIDQFELARFDAELFSVDGDGPAFVVVSVEPSVVFIEQPESSLIEAGGNATISARVHTSGRDRRLQWYRNGVLLKDGEGVSGTTTDRLTIAGLGDRDAGVYTLEVAVDGPPGADGSKPETVTLVSAPAVLAVTGLGVCPECPPDPPFDPDLDGDGDRDLDDILRYFLLFAEVTP